MYRIRPSLDDKIIGTYFQVQDIEKVYNLPSPDQNYEIGALQSLSHPIFLTETGKYDKATIFPIYKMENKSKLTDLLSNVPLQSYCLMISNPFYEFIKTFKLAEHQVFKGEFVHKKILYDNYKILFFVKKKSYKDCVDWKNSIFYKAQNSHKETLEELKYNNWEEMWEAKQQMRKEGFGFRKGLIQIISGSMDFDLFNYGGYPLPLGFICSEKLKGAIEKAGFTGMRFEDIKPEYSFINM